MFQKFYSCSCMLLVLSLLTMPAALALTPEEELGKLIFFDQNLSLNQNQACADCHGPEAGWTGPDTNTNAGGAVYMGSIAGAFGDRKPPSAAYGGDSPLLYQDKKGTWTGGMFWDGRATGWTLGDPLAEQALGPFLNPKEQAMPDAAAVVNEVCGFSYQALFLEVCGMDACDVGNEDAAYDCIGFSIAAYERSTEVSAFTSKFDYAMKGKARLTPQERRGFGLFQGKAKCGKCHPGNGQNPLFTDFTYDNLGIPKNPLNPVYGDNPDFVDLGLGGFLAKAGYMSDVYEQEEGKVKVPTLRNVGLRPNGQFVKAYGHNGFFKSLEGIVHFYNTRDVLPTCGEGLDTEEEALANDCWPAPELATNMNTAELGDLGLSAEEEAAITAFLKTLSDGYVP